MKKLVLASLIAAASTIASSHAVVLEGPLVMFGPVSVGSPIPSIFFPKFDPALGTLISIELQLSAAATNSSLVFDNEGLVAGNASFSLNSSVRAIAAPGVPDAIAPMSVTRSGSLGADGEVGAADFVGPDSLALVGSASSTGSSTENNAPNLAQFVGSTGNYSVALTSSFSAPTLLTFSQGVTGSFSSPTQTVSGGVRPIYNFVPLAAIPEAGTILFGAALGLALGVRRMRGQTA